MENQLNVNEKENPLLNLIVDKLDSFIQNSWEENVGLVSIIQKLLSSKLNVHDEHREEMNFVR